MTYIIQTLNNNMTEVQSYSEAVMRLQNSVTGVVDRRWRDYTNKMKNAKIEDYFGISPDNGDNLSFVLEKDPSDKYCILTVKYVTRNAPNTYCEFADLPESVCILIQEYASKTIEITLKINYAGSCYPFEPPQWSLLEEKNDMTHLPANFALNEYYQDIVDRHNSQYGEIGYNWTPAIDFRTDMLSFIVKINHFPMILEYFE